jgi:ABC-2 type transport system ATP-binding protein
VAQTTAVELHEVSHSYGDTHALAGVSLSVARGEMFGLVGPDGAGKTTLLRVLSGVIAPTGGRVSWRQGLQRGYLSQGFSLYQDLTVDENLEFFAEIHGIREFRRRSAELLGFVGLSPFRRRAAGHLSGGMKKKLALACALVHRPEVLLLDEPTTGVDPVSRRDFWTLLVQLLRNGITVIISTPYLDEAERCMRVGLLEHGAFLAVDTPVEIKRRLRGAVLEIVAGDQRAAYRALLQQGGFDPQQVQPFGDRLHVISSDDDADRAADGVRGTLETAGVTCERIGSIPASLENAFISLVRERSAPS